eukprot:527053-Pelagomonas_calceolata.AAC.1
MDRFCEEISEAGVSGLLVPDIPLEETDEIRAACNKRGLDLVLLVTPTTPVVGSGALAQLQRPSPKFVALSKGNEGIETEGDDVVLAVLLCSVKTQERHDARVDEKMDCHIPIIAGKVTGVTGVQDQLQSRVGDLVNMLHTVTDKPVAVGFGVCVQTRACQANIPWEADGIICIHNVAARQVAVGFGVSKPEHAKQIISWGAEGVICGSALVKLLAEGAPVR